jgi:hypothetical protein
MKHFTKFFLAAVIVAGSFTSSKSQDMGITDGLDPAPLSTIYPNIPTALTFRIKNFGTSAITSTIVDSIRVELRIGGTLVQSSYNIPSPAGTIDYPAGGTVDLVNQTSTDWSALSLGNGVQSVSVCIKSRLKKGGVDIDVNPTNDEVCYTVTYNGDNSPFTFDLQPKDFLVDHPVLGPYPAGAHVPLDGIAAAARYNLFNAGNTDLFEGVPYTYDVTSAGPPVTVTAAVFGPVSQGGQEGHTVNLPSPVKFPMTKGPFNICIKIQPNPDDTDHSNDEWCTEYNAGNPAGVEEEGAQTFGTIYYFNGQLTMEFNELAKGNATLKMFTTSGQEIRSYSYNTEDKKQTIDCSNLSTGIYIVNLVVNGDLLTYQFGVK